MIEEQVDVVIPFLNLQMDLTSDEGEARAHFQQETLDMIDEGLLHLALTTRIRSPQEIEQIRILERSCRHIRLGGWQRSTEVIHSLSVPQMRACAYLSFKHRPTPAFPDTRARIPESRRSILDELKQSQNVSPGQL